MRTPSENGVPARHARNIDPLCSIRISPRSTRARAVRCHAEICAAPRRPEDLGEGCPASPAASTAARNAIWAGERLVVVVMVPLTRWRSALFHPPSDRPDRLKDRGGSPEFLLRTSPALTHQLDRPTPNRLRQVGPTICRESSSQTIQIALCDTILRNVSAEQITHGDMDPAL